MAIYIALAAVFALAGIKFGIKNGFDDYMSPEKTGAVKGLFTFIVLLSHTRQYYTLTQDAANKPFIAVMSWLGQLMVVMFLLYSGYGVSCAIKNKEGYVRTIPVKRAFKVWYHFALCIVIYYVTGLLLGKMYTVKMMLLALVGISGVGNSSWFIIVIILLYLATWIAFSITKNRHMVIGTLLTTLLSFGVFLAVRKLKGSDYWWYDTIMCYPLGMWYALAKPYLDKALLGRFFAWLAAAAASAALFIGADKLMIYDGGTRNIFVIKALLFGILVVIVSMRISINNPVLQWFGKHVFGVYILQRIPMIVLHHYGISEDPVFFTAITIIVTVIIAALFDRFTDWLDVKLKLSKPRKKV